MGGRADKGQKLSHQKTHRFKNDQLTNRLTDLSHQKTHRFNNDQLTNRLTDRLTIEARAELHVGSLSSELLAHAPRPRGGRGGVECGGDGQRAGPLR